MPPALRARVEAAIGAIKDEVKPRNSKYNAQPQVVDGIRFDSKREARYYERLRDLQAAGEVLFFLRQVPLRLPGKTKLVLDFLVFPTWVQVPTRTGELVEIAMQDLLDAGGIRFEDAKGAKTKEFLVKRREIEHHYKVRIALK